MTVEVERAYLFFPPVKKMIVIYQSLFLSPDI